MLEWSRLRAGNGSANPSVPRPSPSLWGFRSIRVACTVRRRVAMNGSWMTTGGLFALGLLTSVVDAQGPWPGSLPPAAHAWSLPGAWGGGSHWWARYGEPVNAAQWSGQGASPSDQPAPTSLEGSAYVYGPGSCDCPPPCIWDLWTGYVQYPKRCHPGCRWLKGSCGCGCPQECLTDYSAGCGSLCLGTRIREVLSRCHGHGPAGGCEVNRPACGCTTAVSTARAGSAATSVR